MTGANDETTRQHVVTAGCVAYLQKPFSDELWLAAVAKAFPVKR